MVDQQARRTAGIAISLVLVFQVMRWFDPPHTVRTDRIELLDAEGRIVATVNGGERGLSIFVKGPTDKDCMLSIQQLPDATHLSITRYDSTDVLKTTSEASWDLVDGEGLRVAQPVDSSAGSEP